MNVYEKYSLKPVINASGKMTILGVSKTDSEVCEAIIEGSTNFFVMKDLLDQTGVYIAKLLNVEAAYCVGSASAGIAQAVASLVCEDRLHDILTLHRNKDSMKREIIIAKGHNVNYGVPVEVMIELGGGKVVEAGYSNECKPEQIEAMITDQTVGLIYIKSHHCVQKSMASIIEYVKIARKYGLALIIDAAAEEDLLKYYDLGGDIVIYSGAKAIEGPTSGLVIGKKKYIDNLKLQNQGIGRAMKIGKEGILGLTKAIELYESKQVGQIEVMKYKVNKLIDLFSNEDKVIAKMVQDSAGREIYRCELCFAKGINVKELVNDLKEGEIAIYTRDYLANIGKIELDVRSVENDELVIIYQRVKALLSGGKYGKNT